MKKFFAVLGTACLLFSGIIGCSKTKSGTEKTAAAKKFKVGLSIYSVSDATSKPVYETCKRAVEAMGGELVLAVDGLDQDKQITQIENLISSGCDAVLFLPYADSAVPTLSRLCQKNKVYFGMYWHDLGSDKDIVMSNPYFIGNTYEDDVWSAYTAMETLHNSGATKIGFFGLPKGRNTTMLRDEGIQKACKDFGMTILVEDRENVNDASDAASSLESFIASYPEMDGVVIAGMTQVVLPGVIQTLSKLGLVGKIKVSAIDYNDNQTTYYEQGALNGIIGGHFCGPAYLVSLIANKLNNTPLVDKPVSIKDNFIVLTGVEDAHNYDKYIATNLAYSEKELASWSRAINSDFTYEDLLKIVQAYSLNDVLKRQGIIQ
jgi:ribose transport system substrate-binding protein